MSGMPPHSWQAFDAVLLTMPWLCNKALGIVGSCILHACRWRASLASYWQCDLVLKCGANACARAHHLARPCPGTCRGFLVQARQRLLLGLHPSSRVPLAAETVPESGQLMPAGFSQARRAAEASKTAAACHRPHVRHSGLSQRALIESPRLVALPARVVAKEAAAKGRLLATPVVQKRRRLRGKQPGR